MYPYLGNKIYNFVDLTLVILTFLLYTHSVWSMFRNREGDFYIKIHYIYTFYLKFYFSLELIVMKLTISHLPTLQIIQTKFGQDWPSSSREEDFNAWRTLTTDDAHHMTQDDWRQPLIKGHLSDRRRFKYVRMKGHALIKERTIKTT